MVAAKIANLATPGRPPEQDNRANLPNIPGAPPPVSTARAAEMLNVSERTVKAARVVRDQAAPELAEKPTCGRSPRICTGRI
jgi:hypothetical protein